MQTIIMTEMLRATAKFQPNGQPTDPEDGYRRAFLDRRNQERQSNVLRNIWRNLRSKLARILAAFHFRNRTQHEVSQKIGEAASSGGLNRWAQHTLQTFQLVFDTAKSSEAAH